MGLPPESVQAGQCYLTEEGRIRRVVGLDPGEWVRYKYTSAECRPKMWRAGRLPLGVFAESLVRQVPCDWSGADEAGADPMGAYGSRGEVIEALRHLVREGVIADFKTLHFGKAEAGEDPAILVTVDGEMDRDTRRALAQRIRAALQPLAGDVVVTIQSTPPSQSGG